MITETYQPLTGTFDALDAFRREFWVGGELRKVLPLSAIQVRTLAFGPEYLAWGAYPDRPKCIMVQVLQPEPVALPTIQHVPSDDTEGGECE